MAIYRRGSLPPSILPPRARSACIAGGDYGNFRWSNLSNHCQKYTFSVHALQKILNTRNAFSRHSVHLILFFIFCWFSILVFPRQKLWYLLFAIVDEDWTFRSSWKPPATTTSTFPKVSFIISSLRNAANTRVAGYNIFECTLGAVC